MIMSFLVAAVGSALTSTMVIESVTAGVSLGIGVYTASKGIRQKNSSGSRR